MIRLTIKVSNDHCSLTENYECTFPFILDPASDELASMVEKTIKAFNQEVDEVVVKTKMEI